MQFLFIVQMLVIILGPLVKMVLKMIGFGFVTYLGSISSLARRRTTCSG